VVGTIFDPDEGEAVKTRSGHASLRQEAADPAAPPARLREIHREQGCFRGRDVSRSQQRVLDALARNPNTPPEVLRELAGTFPDAFLRNPVLPLLLLEDPDFLAPVRPGTLKRLLMRVDVPSLLLAALTHHASGDIADAARRHVALAGEAGDDWQAEVRAVIQEQCVPVRPELVELAELGLAPAVVVEILKQADERAAQPALDGPDTPALASEAPEAVLAADGSQPREILEVLASHPLRAVRAAVAGNPAAAPETLERLAEEHWAEVLERLAANPHAPATVLVRLARWNDVRILERVARHPNTPAETLAALAGHTCPEVRKAIVLHPGVSTVMLLDLAGDPDVEVRRAVRRHPRLPPDTEAILRQVALGRALRGKGPGPFIALLCPEVSEARLETFTRSWEWPERLAAALNAGLPPRLLPALAGDANRLVRAAARARLAGWRAEELV
jgi:hypothetical protein